LVNSTKSLITQKNEGLYCESANTWIDPLKPVEKAIITHAHSDHFTNGCREYICSIETGFLLRKRFGNNINLKTIDYDKNFLINGINFSIHPSGHILGSSQVKIIAGSEIWLITSDLKRQKDKTCKSYEKIKTDYLICESTFGLPIFNWESSDKIINEITKWVNNAEDSTSILFCYSLGKAQRLLSELNNQDFKNIYVHKSINKMNTIYKKLGIELAEAKIFDNDLEINNLENSLLLLPPLLNNKNFLKKFKNVQTSFASGWMSIKALKRRSGFDKGFTISDHADWNGLIKTIKESEAKRVFLNHGDGESLANFLRDKENLNIKQLNKVK
tara:strand:+ start:909 stop:1898 length:990 start_codon:yes stop_codon:yes gene_type:complete